MKYVLMILVLAKTITFSYAHDHHIFKIYMDPDSKPYNYLTEDGNLEGLSINVLNEILKGANFDYESVKVAPWARAFNITLNRPNTMVITIYRTKERENRFTWIGPYAASRLVIVAKKDKPIKDSMPVIASLRGSASATEVEKQKLASKSIKVNEHRQGLDLLLNDRVDGWALPAHTATDLISEKGLDVDDFYIYQTTAVNDLYFAVNKNTDPKIINFFRQRLEDIRQEGLLQDMVYNAITHSLEDNHHNYKHFD